MGGTNVRSRVGYWIVSVPQLFSAVWFIGFSLLKSVWQNYFGCWICIQACNVDSSIVQKDCYAAVNDISYSNNHHSFIPAFITWHKVQAFQRALFKNWQFFKNSRNCPHLCGKKWKIPNSRCFFSKVILWTSRDQYRVQIYLDFCCWLASSFSNIFHVFLSFLETEKSTLVKMSWLWWFIIRSNYVIINMTNHFETQNSCNFLSLLFSYFMSKYCGTLLLYGRYI